MTNTQKVKSSAVAYLMKYVSKCHEMMVFPEGLRLFGVGGLDHSQRAIRSWSNLPEWAKCEYGVGSFGAVALVWWWSIPGSLSSLYGVPS